MPSPHPEADDEFRHEASPAGGNCTPDFTRGTCGTPEMSFDWAIDGMDPVNKLISMEWDRLLNATRNPAMSAAPRVFRFGSGITF